MKQDELRKKQVYSFLQHDEVPPDKVDEEFTRRWGRWDRNREYKHRLVTNKLKECPDLLPDLDSLHQKQSSGMYDDDDAGLSEAIHAICDKYNLNNGWFAWILHYLRTGENEPRWLILSKTQEKNGAVVTTIYFPLSREERDWLTNVQKLKEYLVLGAYKQEQVGGAPRGTRSETKEDYRRIADSYYWSYDRGYYLSQREFCQETGVSRSKLSRALKYVSKNRSETD